jgi:IclR family KDG regulon transcriptional repressor
MAEVLHKAFKLLELLKPNGESKEWGSAELARLAGYNTGTTHRILQIMNEHGIVSQNKQNKKFRLGFALTEYGYLAQSLYSIRELAYPFMEELANETNETIVLNILISSTEALLIDSIDSTHKLRIVEPIGLRLPLYIGASRKVMLANMRPDKQAESIRKFSWKARTQNTVIDENMLSQEINQIKQQGYAISRGETTVGTFGIAVPIFGGNGVEASLMIAGPDIRISEQRLIELVDKLKEKARRVSMLLGGHK